jgi:hypothetical protein
LNPQPNEEVEDSLKIPKTRTLRSMGFAYYSSKEYHFKLSPNPYIALAASGDEEIDFHVEGS